MQQIYMPDVHTTVISLNRFLVFKISDKCWISVMLCCISLGANELSVMCWMRTLLYILKLVKNKYQNVLLHENVDISMM
jgi:hypothetical protein